MRAQYHDIVCHFERILSHELGDLIAKIPLMVSITVGTYMLVLAHRLLLSMTDIFCVE